MINVIDKYLMYIQTMSTRSPIYIKLYIYRNKGRMGKLGNYFGLCGKVWRVW